MGDEISHTKFSAEVYEEFRNRLDMETVILQQWVDEGRLHSNTPWAGAELEAWLVDDSGNPAANNDAFLSSLNNPMVVHELAKFNVELNTEPLEIKPGFLETMHDNMWSLWQQGVETASELSNQLVMTGILPTITEAELCLQNQSNLKRYTALNEQVFRLRSGAPIHLDINGREHLVTDHSDVMLEAATTSFQVHYKVDVDMAAHAYNASRILSAPMVAVAANSPFLFGHDLWAETRIPLFEQAVQVGGSAYASRVSFGLRHITDSIMDCFNANRTRYQTLLPELMDTKPEELAHLRMHNGTIWRWNRPLVGFSSDGQPHIRIEHRVAAAGPTMRDVIANAAFYFGALTALLENPSWIESAIPNRAAARNFYKCAKFGLDASVSWDEGSKIPVNELITEKLIPLATKGLMSIGYTAQDAGYWMEIIKQRTTSGQNGATWQRNWIAKHGKDFNQLTQAYLENQKSNEPVHTWSI